MLLYDEIGYTSMAEFEIADGVLDWEILVIGVKVVEFGGVIVEDCSIHHLISVLLPVCDLVVGLRKACFCLEFLELFDELWVVMLNAKLIFDDCGVIEQHHDLIAIGVGDSCYMVNRGGFDRFFGFFVIVEDVVNLLLKAVYACN